MKETVQKNWHNISQEDILKKFQTKDDYGLELSEIDQRKKKFGLNKLTQKKGQGPFVRFLLQFNQALVYILLAAVIIKLLLGAYIDAGVIFGVVLLNSVIGFMQEGKALSALNALAQALNTETTVLRGGEKQIIDAKELVPGDIVLLSSGDKVPADLRLLQSRSLQIDESALTGESLPVEKKTGVLDNKTILAERTNMAYSSTLVTYGTCVGVVIGTGDNTEIGRISVLISSAEVLATPLTRKIAKFSHILLYTILALAVITFMVGMYHGGNWIDLFMSAVALSVAMIPEGLPAVLTITLAIGVSRMAKRHAIIRNLPAVETLGSTTVICSDKTGTLTRNEMTVQKIWAGNEIFSVSGIGYSPEGEIQKDDKKIDISTNVALNELLRAGLICNESVLKENEEGWKVEGDPTEGALLAAAFKGDLDLEKEIKAYPRIDTIPFESEYKYMVTLHGGDKPIIYLKGSVESMLARSEFIMDADGELKELNHDAVHAQVEALAEQGQRVLAFACLSKLPSDMTTIDHHDVEKGLIFLGIQGMIDPPRQEVIEAVSVCQTAGIRVKMITGDHALTASAIAGQIGLDETVAQGEMPKVLTGGELEGLSDEEMIEAATKTSVFARVTPEQKLRLVEALQSHGEVVAMTGDGVNDAPALRRADIGVAMGITGTEVSKEAADMILTDDNFATITAAVEEGRGVFDNLIKFLTWILPTNAGQGLVIIIAVMLSQPLPILPVQALWINMTTAVLLGLALAFEPREPGIMTRSPRKPNVSLLSGELVFRVLLVGFMLLVGSFGLFEWALHNGASEDKARTIAVNVFAVGQAFYLLNCRSLRFSIFRLGIFTNMWIWIGIAAMATAQLLFTYLPIMNTMFHTAPIGLMDWVHIVIVGIIIYTVIDVEKAYRRKKEK